MIRIQALVLYDLLLLLISRAWYLAEGRFDGHFLKITSQLKSKSDKGIYLQIGLDNSYVHTFMYVFINVKNVKNAMSILYVHVHFNFYEHVQCFKSGPSFLKKMISMSFNPLSNDMTIYYDQNCQICFLFLLSFKKVWSCFYVFTFILKGLQQPSFLIQI